MRWVSVPSVGQWDATDRHESSLDIAKARAQEWASGNRHELTGEVVVFEEPEWLVTYRFGVAKVGLKVCASCGGGNHQRWCPDYEGDRPLCAACRRPNTDHTEDCANRPCRCRTHLGTQKVRYESKWAALKAASHMAKPMGYGRVYRCPTSAVWHTTTRIRYS